MAGGSGAEEMTTGYFGDQQEPVVVRMTLEEYRALYADLESVSRHTMPAIVKLCKGFQSILHVVGA